MTAPVFPQQYPVQQYPPQWPQQAQQPYPQPQAYAPGYPPATPAAPAAPLAQGSIDDFYNQPSSGGGAFLKFEVGTVHVGIVARAITSGDIRQKTTPPAQGSQPQFFKDGRPRFEMLVPLKVQPNQQHPDGLATWAVSGADRDELVRAMAEAGAPAGPPEPDAAIQIACTRLQPTRGGIPRKVKHVTYTRPSGETSSPAPAVAQPVPQQAFVPQVPAQAAPAQPAPAAQPAATPAGLSPEQQALLAKLTGAQG